MSPTQNEVFPLPVNLLLSAYSAGYFPMGMPDGTIGWLSPDPRGIIPLKTPLHLPHGIRRDLKKRNWQIRCNTAFENVIKGCASRPETWINHVIISSYLDLHRSDFAHSVEVWLDNQLVGGLYGVHLGAAFFGESMFSKVSGASKVALVWLIENLAAAGFQLLDTQWLTDHLRLFGGMEVPRAEYLSLLKLALQRHVKFPTSSQTPE